ncbi:uroporphyrinogen decarboxylase [Oceanobacillus sp. AG]|uniref:uroporphyrinogen decarboxylase n=1 Tax=Oceanobacillus sp. AG TaxID=2681969 RepID=UPI0012EC1B79|nr:uroporphyrinogen decarboxylase [Oceanobacillus sp. AG]
MTKKMNDTILQAYRGKETSYTPAWFMRQAGRSQPEYQEIKKKYSLFEITHQPELSAYVTRLPVENYNVDAAILYKDIMTPLPAMGIDVEIKAGIGPVVDNPIRSFQDVEALGTINPNADIPYILDTIRILTEEQLEVPLIGFSGAPFTLASYMIEGGPSKSYHETKKLMYLEPETWFLLMDKLADMIITYVEAQVEAGARAIQLFDSWVGSLNAPDYRVFIKPVMTRICSELRKLDVPLIIFGVGARHLLLEWNDLPVDVIGLDWRTSITEARNMGVTKVLQGNLDPVMLLTEWENIEKRTKNILDEGIKQGKHVFNLGHGVTPEIKPETLKKLTNLVHEYSKRS